MYFWLSSPDEARGRVAMRVSRGGHNIPDDVIDRRYYRGLYNLHHLYIPVCDFWIVVNNTDTDPEMVGEGEFNNSKVIYNYDIWNRIKGQSDENKG